MRTLGIRRRVTARSTFRQPPRWAREGVATPKDPTEPHVLVGEGDSRPHRLADVTRDAARFGDQPVVELRSGLTIPALGIGTWRLDDDTAERIVTDALDLGVRHVDTAQMYGNESGVGRAIAASGVDRGDMFLTTKIDNDNHEPDALVESVERSLECLGTDHVDLLLVHWPVHFDRMGATLSTLAQVQASGLADHLGVSNFTTEQLDQVHELAPLEVLQCECHPFLQQTELRSWCVEHGWSFTAYSPLAQGEVMNDQALRDIAADHDVSASTIALAWLLAQPHVNTIPRTTSGEHLRDNWAALNVELDQRELDRISVLDEARRLVSPDFAPW